ncbi:MAG: MauE/DoxX family redox-associated membrane protein [Candidatus Eisenbacteria bacterium]|nr:MauE/DoxX family redox-associated membrane protein [Candidatus Eisenbacteria bacterium]
MIQGENREHNMTSAPTAGSGFCGNLRKFSSNHKVLFVMRIIVGVIFILASVYKVGNPDHFRAVVAEYRLMPEQLVPLVAVTLPWVEFICGVMLILGVYSRSNALIVVGVLCVYIAGMTINLSRGLVHDCGCFDFFNEEIGIGTIVRDLVFLILAIPILLYDRNSLLKKT